MSDNYNDKDIERLIFRDGLESSEIEPSEKFWNKSFEGILQRENRTYLNRVSQWRGTLFIMGAVILLLGSYAIYMHNEVSNMKQQLAKIESTQANTLQQVAMQNSAISSMGSPHKEIQQSNEASTVASASKMSTNSFPTKEPRRTQNQTTNSSSLPITQQSVNISSNTNHNESVVNSSTSSINNGISGENITVPTETRIAVNTSSQAGGNNSFPTTNSSQSSVSQLTKSTISDKKTDSLKAVASLDSVNSLLPDKKPITLAGVVSKFSVSAFYAPGMTDDFLNDKDNDPTHTITANELKTRQDGGGTFAIGLRLAYDISDKWTIQTGCYYSEHSYNIKPAIIYAQQQENGQVGYSIATSSGTNFIPNSTVPAHLGDSIKVKGSSSRGYISIPLQAKYKFAAGTKLSFYATGGFSINIANYQKTTIDWENTSFQEGDLSVQNIYGLNTIQYSYSFGIGASYLIRKGLSIYTEPFVNGSFTAINKNTPVITYPYFFGLALGITYHF